MRDSPCAYKVSMRTESKRKVKVSKSKHNTYPAALPPSLAVSWALSVMSSALRPGRISKLTYELSRRCGIASNKYVEGKIDRRVQKQQHILKSVTASFYKT